MLTDNEIQCLDPGLGHQMPEATTAADKAEMTGLKGKPAETEFTPPEYTMKEILDAIPKHCLERSTGRSLFYVARDFVFVATLGSIATQIPRIASPHLQIAAWVGYSFTQGLIFTGLWELAHECGHGALSPKKWVNNAVGLVLHSFLLVPYYSWRITHSQHHKATNNLDRDIAFVPMLKEDFIAERKTHMPVWEAIEDTPIITLGFLFFHQLIAFPLYLTINNFALERMAAAPWWKRSHFYLGGDGPNFRPENFRSILLSDLGIATMAMILWGGVRLFGAWNVILFYGFPYLWTNHWILTITYLQHTDPVLPYYPAKSWTFLRGAASAVDRDFGFIGRVLFHGAVETHVVHHHNSRIPFYHAAEASAAIRDVMGTHYKSKFKDSYMMSFWGNFRVCRWVEESGKSGAYFFGKLD